MTSLENLQKKSEIKIDTEQLLINSLSPIQALDVGSFPYLSSMNPDVNIMAIPYYANLGHENVYPYNEPYQSMLPFHNLSLPQIVSDHTNYFTGVFPFTPSTYMHTQPEMSVTSSLLFTGIVDPKPSTVFDNNLLLTQAL